jgi:hypothetical protein
VVYFGVSRNARQRSQSRTRLLGDKRLKASETNEVAQAACDVCMVPIHHREQQLVLIRQLEAERWLGESEQSDKWDPCLIAALMPRDRREDVETNTAKP